MEQKIIKQLKEKLEKEKVLVEKELASFADKNLAVKGDWKSKFPDYNVEDIEEKADEVEEFMTRVSTEKNLELKLKRINLALGKIQKNKYGICENCGKKISQERLSVSPDARMCGKCVK